MQLHSGDVLSAHAVVCALPLGVLKVPFINLCLLYVLRRGTGTATRERRAVHPAAARLEARVNTAARVWFAE